VDGERRPGPKPKRLYIRVARFGALDRDELPEPRAVRSFIANLDRVGRLVGHGNLTDPRGDALVLRAVDLAEARRILRLDPFRPVEGIAYELLEWDAGDFGAGVNLEPPPARGSGRLTVLQRVSVVVRDQASSLPWYRDVLGLTPRVQDPATGYLELALGRGTAAISLVEPREEWGEPYYSETVPRIGSATGIVFQTDSVFALEQRLLRSGSAITQRPERQPWGGVTVRFADPDGNEFLAFQVEDDPTAPTAGARHPAKTAPAVRWARRPPRPKRL
jgi:catechol 2,3-dioxygenase-like lactoylglutathione lyase family enzyme